MNSRIFIASLFITLFSLPIGSFEFSVMTLNAQNLFDTIDDKGKDDKAFLPIELKKSNEHIRSCKNIKVTSWKNECLYLDWDPETKDAKLRNLFTNIIEYDQKGPDILALQEVENENILRQLFVLLKPYGYVDFKLIEGRDYRGIDTAIISKFKINGVEFGGKKIPIFAGPNMVESKDLIFDLKAERESAATAASKLKANRISAAEAESSNMKKQQVAPFSLGARHWRTPKALPSVRINCDWKQQRLAL